MRERERGGGEEVRKKGCERGACIGLFHKIIVHPY